MEARDYEDSSASRGDRQATKVSLHMGTWVSMSPVNNEKFKQANMSRVRSCGLDILAGAQPDGDRSNITAMDDVRLVTPSFLQRSICHKSSTSI